MRPLISFISVLFFPAFVFAQASDFIVVKKKNNRTVKSYFPGAPITCETIYGSYISGVVEAVRNDSVFIRQYDIRPVPTYYGVSKMDTLASYITGVHYKHLRVMLFEERRSFGYISNGNIFIIGGLGYAALNLINGGYLKEPILKGQNGKRLGIAFGVAGAGFLLKHFNNRSRHKSKYRIEYIKMTVPKQRSA